MPKWKVLHDDVVEQIRKKIDSMESEFNDDRIIRSPVRILHSLYGACLVVSKIIPPTKLSHLLDQDTLREDLSGAYSSFDLPATRFRYMQDEGIVWIKLYTDATNFRIYNVGEMVSKSAIREANGNPWQNGNPLFHIDYMGGVYEVVGAEKSQLEFLALFTEPTTANYTTEDFPLDEPYDRQVVNLAVQHLVSMKSGNSITSQIEEALNETAAEVPSE